MRDFLSKYGFVVIASVIIVILIGFNILREYRASKTTYQSKQNETYESIPKKIGVNEYTNINMSKDTLVKMYFDDFKGYALGDINKSYLSLDDDYRQNRFPTIETYKKYIENLNLPTAKASKFNIINGDDYTIYIVYDNNDNYYAFKVTGVLEYKVYLDDYTVEIR